MKADFSATDLGVTGSPATSFAIGFNVDVQHPTGFSRALYEAFGRGELTATRCQTCGRTSFPPTRRCPERSCAGFRTPTEWYVLPGTGTVVAETLVHSPPPYDDVTVPYRIGLIDLDDVDGRLLHRVEGDVGVGGRVRANFSGAHAQHPLHMFNFCPEATLS